MHNLPIGIFDSGVGGLTVLKEMAAVMPRESFLYLGDTARLPYGTKSPETVLEYAKNAAGFLTNQGVKCLVVACNTASSVAIDYLSKQLAPIPIIGVVEAGVTATLESMPEGIVGVLATQGTVASQTYSLGFKKLAPNLQVIEWPCSLLVALAEEGWVKGPLVEAILKELLQEVIRCDQDKKLSTIILGCTHFPVFISVFQQIFSKRVNIINSAEAVTRQVKKLLIAKGLVSSSQTKGEIKYYATDNKQRFVEIAQIFLNKELSDKQVNLADCISSSNIKLSNIRAG